MNVSPVIYKGDRRDVVNVSPVIHKDDRRGCCECLTCDTQRMTGGDVVNVSPVIHRG